MGCFRALRNPPKELAELMSLHGILATLHDHLSTLHNGHDLRNLLALEVLDQPDGALAACKVVLQDVLDILEGLQKRRLASVIAAATSSQKFLESKCGIERLKALLTLVLSSDHLYALRSSLPCLCTRFFVQIQFQSSPVSSQG